MLRYSPADGFTGQDAFVYRVTNTRGMTSWAQVTVTVTAAVHPLGAIPLRVRVSASATGELEPGVGPTP